MNQIMLMLGLNASGFFGGLKRGSDQVKAFEKDWRGLQKIFGAGGLTYAVVGFFDAMISRANEAKGELDANTAAVQRFGKALEEGKNTAGSWGVTVLGWLNRIGEAYGEFSATNENFFKRFLSAPTLDTGKLRGIYEEERAQVVQRSKNAEAADARERATAGFKKKFGEDSLKLADSQKQAEERYAEARLKGLSLQEQYNVRENELYKLVVQRANFEGTVLQRRELDLKVTQAKTKMVEAEVALNKENAAVAKRAGEEKVRAAENAAKKHEDEVDRLNKAKFEGLSLDKQIETLAKSRVSLEENIQALKRDGLDTTTEEADLAEVINELTKSRAEQTEKVAEAEKKARKEAEGHAEAIKITQRAYEAIIFGTTNGGRDAREIQGASPEALRELLSRNNAQLTRLRGGAPGFSPTAMNDNYADTVNILRLENENRRLQREIDTREDFQRNYATLGPEGARRAFGGDPLLFDRFVDQFVKTQTETSQTNNLLRDLINRVGPDYAGNLPAAVESLSDKIDRAGQSISAHLAAQNRT
jgi:biotin operon repressor